LREAQPVLAAALLIGKLAELGDDRVATLVESGELFMGLKLAGPGSRRGAAESGDGRHEPWGVLRDEFDDFAVEMERAIADGGDEGAIRIRRDGSKLSELEVSGAELLPEVDDLVRVSAIDSEVTGTEVAPARRLAKIRARSAEAMEASGLGGGTAAGDEAECVRLAEDGTEVQRGGGIGFRG
jgi:hypothetical protein